MANTPPTYVTRYQIPMSGSTTPRTVSVTVADGDVLYAAALSGTTTRTISAPTGGTGLTWTLVKSSTGVGGRGNVYLWRCDVGTGQGQTFTLSVASPSGGTGGTWGVEIIRVSNHNGEGASVVGTAVSASAPSLNITTVSDNSMVFVAWSDESETSIATRAYRTNAGTATEMVAVNSSNFAGYVIRHNDAGTAGTKALGATAPATQTWAMVAVEIKGKPAGGPVALDAKASTATSATANLTRRRPADLLTENFAAGSIDTAKWPNAFGTPTQSGGVGQVPAAASGNIDNGFGSQAIYMLADSAVAVLATTPSLDASTYAWAGLTCYANAPTYTTFARVTLLRRATGLFIGGAVVVTGSTVYSATEVSIADAPTWLRLREASGTLYAEYSADGQNFTTAWSYATPAAFLVEGQEIDLEAQRTATTGDGTAATFDHLNLPLVQITASGAAASGATAELARARPLAAQAFAATDASGALTRGRALDAVSASATGATADLSIARGLSGSAPVASGGSGAMTLGLALEAASATASGAAADLSVARGLAATAATTSDGAALLGLAGPPALSDSVYQGPTSVTLEVVAGEVLILLNGWDWGARTAMPTPTDDAGMTWDLLTEDAHTANAPMVKVWRTVAPAVGEVTIECAAASADSWNHLHLWRFPAGTTTPDAAAAIGSGAAVVAPSLPDALTTDVMLTSALKSYHGAGTDFAPPPGTTSVVETDPTGEYSTMASGITPVTADGATGTRTWTAPFSLVDWTATSTLVRPGTAGPVALDAAGSTATSASADLSVTRPLSAGGSASAAATATAQVVRALEATAPAATDGTAVLARARSLDAVAATAADVAAALDVERGLGSAVGSTASAAGAELARAAHLVAQAHTAADADATIDTERGLSATVEAATGGVAVLTRAVALEAGSDTASDAIAELSVTSPQGLDAVCATATDGSAELSVARAIDAIAAEASSGEALLGRARGLDASGASAAAAGASLDGGRGLDAVGAVAADVAAALAVARSWSATVSTATSATAELDVLAAVGLEASGATATDARADLDVARVLFAESRTASAGTAAMTRAVALSAVAAAVTSGRAQLALRSIVYPLHAGEVVDLLDQMSAGQLVDLVARLHAGETVDLLDVLHAGEPIEV